MSNISFGSTYTVFKKDNKMGAYSNFVRYALEKEQERDVYFDILKEKTSKYPFRETVAYRLEAPNRFDNEIERYCAFMGIKYEKSTPEISMKKDDIINRIAIPRSGMWQVEIDAKKLEKLIEKQNSNIKHCESDYEKYFKDDIRKMFECGKPFSTTTLNLATTMSEDDLGNYIESFGVENLNGNELFIDFNQKTLMPDHCVYFAFRDLGLDKIPVYVDYRQLDLCDKLGLFE